MHVILNCVFSCLSYIISEMKIDNKSQFNKKPWWNCAMVLSYWVLVIGSWLLSNPVWQTAQCDEFHVRAKCESNPVPPAHADRSTRKHTRRGRIPRSRSRALQNSWQQSDKQQSDWSSSDEKARFLAIRTPPDACEPSTRIGWGQIIKHPIRPVRLPPGLHFRKSVLQCSKIIRSWLFRWALRLGPCHLVDLINFKPSSCGSAESNYRIGKFAVGTHGLCPVEVRSGAVCRVCLRSRVARWWYTTDRYKLLWASARRPNAQMWHPVWSNSKPDFAPLQLGSGVSGWERGRHGVTQLFVGFMDDMPSGMVHWSRWTSAMHSTALSTKVCSMPCLHICQNFTNSIQAFVFRPLIACIWQVSQVLSEVEVHAVKPSRTHICCCLVLQPILESLGCPLRVGYMGRPESERFCSETCRRGSDYAIFGSGGRS